MTSRRNPLNIPERFLRQLWKRQKFSATEMQTIDGKPIFIVSPGTTNPDGGPDFIGARVRVNGILYRGDVELHQNVEDWRNHEHHLDAKYNGVVLHVVLFGHPSEVSTVTKSGRSIHVLVLQPYLVSTYHSLWEDMILDERLERVSTVPCFPSNEAVDPFLIRRILLKLAVERIELKVRRFEERLLASVDEHRRCIKEPPAAYEDVPFGLNPEDLPPPTRQPSQLEFRNIRLWEQLLYEGMMEALGYSKNQKPFLKLARNVRLEFFERLNISGNSFLEIEASLFGVAGLLPALRSLTEPASRAYVRNLRAEWKNVRPLYNNEISNDAEWQFFRLRPENFPTVRLAGAARLIFKLLKEDFLKRTVQTIKNAELSAGKKIDALRSTLIIPADNFWQDHYLFGVKAKCPVRTLIGESRANEIFLNAILPICLLYARLFKDKDVRREALSIFEACPSPGDNSATRIVDQQIVKTRFKLDSAVLQQGAVQLYKFYCADKRCEECAIGKNLADA